MNQRSLILSGIILISLAMSSCATQPLKGRGEQNLEDWDASMVYDPITKRTYHTAAVKSAQEAQHDAFIQDIIED